MAKRTVGYIAAHGRVRRARGSASEHSCLHCHKSAEDWAYDHKDPEELTETAYGKYSMKIEHYIPLCCKCHAKFDLRGYKQDPKRLYPRRA